jgi:asparagine synthase (glutamine-hydrolysing)
VNEHGASRSWNTECLLVLGLGYNRLSINDLSPEGNQPIHSDDGNIHAVVNGEIYDFERLREVCIREDGYQFHGHSDSELVVALYKKHGAPDFFKYLRGEFAFVLYDERNGKVIAACDRFGIKPLFYTTVDDGDEKRLLIASEAKAFLALDWSPEWAVDEIVTAAWHHGDTSLFKGVKKILPGHWMELSSSGELKHECYWEPEYRDKVIMSHSSCQHSILLYLWLILV